jgi:hypothetical protein
LSSESGIIFFIQFGEYLGVRTSFDDMILR